MIPDIGGPAAPTANDSGPMRAAFFVRDLLDHARTLIVAYRTKREHERYCRYWEDELGHLPAAEVRPGQIEAYLARRIAAGLSPQTVDHELCMIRVAYRWGVRDGLVPSNPAADLRVPRYQAPPRRPLRDEEEEPLLEACPAQLARAIQIAILTGMRLAEQTGLLREQVDWDNHLIEIRSTKTGRPRWIPLSRRAEGILREQLEDAGPSLWVWPSPQDPARPVGRSTFSAGLRRVCRALGIVSLTWHGLRHTTATRLLRAGADIRQVQQILGHTALSSTMVYTQVCPGQLASRMEDLAGWSERLGPRREPARVRRSIVPHGARAWLHRAIRGAKT